MKGQTRGLEFWENYTYRIKIEFYYPKTKEKEFRFVTKVNFGTKTFEYKTLEEIEKEGADIQAFKLEEAVELMNCMYINGYQASIEPYFKN